METKRSFKKYYETHKKEHRARCDKWRKEHKKEYYAWLKGYNKKRRDAKRVVHDKNCSICGTAFQTSNANKKICDNPECKKKNQYQQWLKWVENNKERRREIARNSLNKRNKENKIGTGNA